MFNTVLRVAAVAGLCYISFQVGRNWNEIAADAAEVVASTADPQVPTGPETGTTIPTGE
ncbi:hypothetical protein MZD04_gp134 [Pseudomonas phage Psa21]|uniref:Uncharacterized protein n=1 Tax=Pseudomonas phage Psa21 TaxID=2530023 RepID=A0A481W4J5_9CAUD|nr:hypothetical protein MZD04_gp134 [Pseudomonas phage Psa21]QBJ02661.1 hypothetical protein PSA21_134 [Pseudomonas phage Psa21]